MIGPQHIGASLYRLVLLSLLCGLVHCAAPNDGEDPTGNFDQPIVNGATGTAEHAEVILDFPSGDCSATMISNLWLLTAAHCVAGLQPSQLSVTVVDNGSFDFPTAEEIVIEPDASLDVAMVRLRLSGTPVSGSFFGFNRPIYAGTTLSLLGVTVFCTGQGANAYNALTDAATGDGVLRWTNYGVNVTATVGSTLLRIDQNTMGQIPFLGDSGGGCYTFDGQLVGVTVVTSRPPSFVFVQSVEAFRTWMRQVMASRIGVFNNGQWWLDRNGTRAWEGSGVSPDSYYPSFGAGLKPVTWNTGFSHTVVPRLGATHIGAFSAAGQWYRDEDFNGAWNPAIDIYISLFGGAPGDQPITGQWLGVNQIDAVGVFRSGPWYLDGNYNNVWNSAPPDVAVSSFGSGGDVALGGSWSGAIAISRIAVFNNGTWKIDLNGDGVLNAGDRTTSFGQPGDKPVAGDWNGAGNDEIGVYNSGTWWLDANGDFTWDTGDVMITGFGQPSDTPVAGRW